MQTLTIHIKKKSDVSLIKRFLKALNVEIEEESKEITNPEILEILKNLEENKNNSDYIEKNFKTINPKNVWESIMSE